MSVSSLPAVASWDVALLRNAVATLGAVGDRLVSWRARMEGVGRALETTDSWSGPAAAASAQSLLRVSTVVTEVTAALMRSLDEADRMVAGADAAAELAGEALAAAAAVPVALDGRGQLGPLPEVPLGPALDPAEALAQQYEAVAEQARAAGRAAELATAALRSADLAALAAEDAVAALGDVGVVAGRVPAGFLDLTASVAVGGDSAWAPPPATAPAVAAWWAAMSEEQRHTLIDQDPELIGGLEGLPAWARDRANRHVLDRLLVEPGAPGHDVALATREELTRREDAGEVVQLYEFVPGQGLAAVSQGDLDTADDIGVLVPGTGTTVVDDLDAVLGDAADVAAAASAAAPGATVATLAWIGYRTPPDPGAAVGQDDARAGGAALATTLGGLAATRSATAGPANTVVFAHSYGAEVVAEAAGAPGTLAADTVVLLGPPGMAGDAADLEVGEVFYALGGEDPIGLVPLVPDVPGHPVFANPVWDPRYGATALPVEGDMGHSDYYDTDRPTAAAMGEVLVDVRQP